MKKHIFLVLLLLVGVFTYAFDGAVSLSRNNDAVISKVKLAQMFPSDQYREAQAGSYTYFKPRARVGETIKLCGGVLAKVITAPRSGKIGLVWADRIYLKFKDQKTRTYKSVNNFLKGLGSEIMPNLQKADKVAFVAKVPDGQTPEGFIKALNNRPEIEYAEYKPIYYTYYTPTDPGYSSQWNLALLKMEDGWNVTLGDASIILEINDSGVSLYTNADNVNTSNISPSGSYVKGRELQNVAIYNNGATIIDPYNTDTDAEDDFGHGTFLANIIFADHDAQDGAGMAPNCTIMPYKSGGCSGTVGYGDKGIVYGTGIAKAINCSYGGPTYSATVDQHCTDAWNAGTIVVVASGNDGANSMGYPAGYINSVAVGATTNSGAWWSSSNWDEGATAGYQQEADEIFCVTGSANMYGTYMQFSSWNGSGYDCGTADPSSQGWGSGNYGTSYSCPQLVGMIGLMASAGVVDPQTIIDIIANTCDHTSNGNSPSTATSSISGASTYDWKYGHGLPDVGAALLQCSPAPYIVYDSKTFDDSLGDNDGIPEAGEDVKITVTLKNNGPNDPIAGFTSVSATFSSDDYYIGITDNTSAFPNIAANGATGTASDPFQVTLDEYTPNLHEVEFSMFITGKYDSGNKDYSATRSFKMTVGSTDIIIVDLDSGACVNGYNVNSEARLGESLTALNWQYEYVNQTPVDLTYPRFKVVFVTLGNYAYLWSSDFDTLQILDSEDRNSIEGFINDTGNVYIEGSGESQRYGSTSLWTYFGTNYTANTDRGYDIGNITDVTGQKSTVGANIPASTLYENYAVNNCGAFTDSYNTLLSPTSATIAVLSNGPQSKSGTRVVQWDNPNPQGKTIWSDVLFAGINTTVDNDAVRNQYMDDIMDFFGYSTNPTDSTAPAKTTITEINLNPYNEGIVSLKWTAPGDDNWGGHNINGSYDMEYKKGAAGAWTNATGEPSPPKAPEEVESMTISSLTGGNVYYFRVRTSDEKPNWSDYSDEVSIYVESAPACWGGSSYPGKVIMIWVENNPDMLGDAQESANEFKTELGSRGFSYNEIATANDIGDLSSYDLVLFFGGTCNYSGNVKSYFDSIDANRQQDYLNIGGRKLYTELHWADQLLAGAYSDYSLNYLGAVDNGFWDNHGVCSPCNPQWTYNIAGQAGTYAAGDSISAFSNATYQFEHSMTAGGSGTAAYRSANGYFNSVQTTDSILSTMITIGINNATERADYVDRVLNGLGCPLTGTDNCPPNTIEDLTAMLSATVGEIWLHWTAPGDDILLGGGAGTCTAYTVRRSASPITEANFGSATNVTGTIPNPASAGKSESMRVTSLTSGNGYYFCIRAEDEGARYSYSNSPYIYLPANQAYPRVLVWDNSQPGMTTWGAGSGNYSGPPDDYGNPGEMRAKPIARALQNLGYSIDYIEDDTTNRENSGAVLPSLSNYDIFFYLGFTWHGSDRFCPTDVNSINAFINTNDKCMYFEDNYGVARYGDSYDSLGDGQSAEASFWDSFSSEWWDMSPGAASGGIKSFIGTDFYGISKGMRFHYPYGTYIDHNIMSFEPRNYNEAGSWLDADQTNSYVSSGEKFGIARYSGIGSNIHTVMMGAWIAALTPYDDNLYASSSMTNVIKNIMTFFGYTGNTVVEDDNSFVHPAWSPNGIDGYYLYSFYGSNPALYKLYNLAYNEADNKSIYTRVDAGIHHGSNITTDGTNVYYGRYDSGNNYMEIYKVPENDSAAPSAIYPVGAGTKAPWVKKWYDPDYIDGTVFADNKPRIAASHAGEIVTYLANSADANDPDTLDIVRLTGFQGSIENDDTIEPKCYQCRWAPDGNSVVFVYRPATPSGTAAKSGIYVISDVLNTIAISSPTKQYWATSLSDSRITKVYGFDKHPSWSPSFSQDGTVISFALDPTDKFDNHDFLTNPMIALQNTNFDVYKKDWQILAQIPQNMIHSEDDEAFIQWAPEGGDKLVQASYNKTRGKFTLFSFADESNVFGGWTNKAGESGLKVSDHAKTSLEIKGDITEYGFKTIKILPVQKKFDIPNGYKYFGASRTIVTEPRGTVIPNGANLQLHFTKGAMYNVDLDKEKLGLYYVNNDKLEKVNANIALCKDGYEGYAYANITKQGDYVICALPKASAYDSFKDVRVFPNPVRVGKVQGGTTVEGAVFDKLPDNVTNIDIYNIAGEKVATLDDDAVTCYDPALNTHYPNIDPNGVSVYWDLNNCDGEKVASGIYIVILKAEGIDPIYKKVAVIK